MIQAASPIFTGDMWLQQKFCRLQKLSTHKDNNSYNYNYVQSNKDKGDGIPNRYAVPLLCPLGKRIVSYPKKLFCVIELLSHLLRLSFLFGIMPLIGNDNIMIPRTYRPLFRKCGEACTFHEAGASAAQHSKYDG